MEAELGARGGAEGSLPEGKLRLAEICSQQDGEPHQEALTILRSGHKSDICQESQQGKKWPDRPGALAKEKDTTHKAPKLPLDHEVESIQPVPTYPEAILENLGKVRVKN